jgi:alpha-L-fucosidase
VVSKNGNLLLNIPMKGDGTIDDKEIAVVQGIASWMAVNKQSILNTRPWKVFGEGPAAEASNPINAQGFNEGKIKFTSRDIRFAQYGKILYATVMGVPGENVIIKNFGSSTLLAKIAKVELLGSKEKVKWTQNADRLEIEKPVSMPNEIALVYKVSQK